MHIGSDFSPLINEEITFGPSETIKFVMVPITQDNTFEGEESFTAVLSPVPGTSGVEIGRQGTATTTIIDGRSHVMLCVHFNTAMHCSL